MSSPATATMLALGGDCRAHPDLEPLLTDVGNLRPHERNPRNGDVEAIMESMRVNGLYRPVYAQTSTGRILAGNHTYAAALELGATRLPVVWLDVDDEAALRVMAVDNRAADLGTYDDALLLDLLASLQNTDLELLGTGYDDDAVTAILAAEAAAADADLGTDLDDNRAPTTGEMLAIADVTMGEPRHKVHHGEVWRLGRHMLVIARVHDEHPVWLRWLEADMVFAPYPEPYLTSGTLAEERALLLVQPNVFLAGHLIDKHVSTHPDDDLVQVA